MVYLLSMVIDLFAHDLNKVSNDALFSAVAEFAKGQPNEGWRHDYTEKWDDSAIRKVAAFANTFGGLLIVGVRKQKHDVVCELVGVDSQTEYKTSIASSIAANISPAPSYDIFECYRPEAPNSKLCVVRVRTSRALHLVTKKGLQPVYVRNEDEARPADAAQLRRLIDREREMQSHPQTATEQAYRLRDALVINCNYEDKDSEAWFLSACQHSSTFLKLELTPTETISLDMERSHEDRLCNLIAEIYPRVRDTVGRDTASQAESRGQDFYEYAWYHKGLDYEGRWRITGEGGIAHGTQVKSQHGTDKAFWSVVDLAIHTILFVRLSVRWWETIGYFGEGRLYAQLSVSGLEALRRADGTFTCAFDPRYQPTARWAGGTIRADAILVSGQPRSSANAEIKVNYFSANTDLARTTTSLLNLLLRSLGHAVNWKELEDSIQLLAKS